MAKYVLKRLLLMIPVILFVAVMIFTIMYFVPGDPASLILGSSATEEQLIAKRIELGLDQPYHIRLFDFLKNLILRFDFGSSFTTKTAVTAELLQRFPRTLIIAGVAMLVSVLIGVPLGIVSAVHQDTVLDRVTMVGAVVGSSMPTFWIAMLMVLLFSLKLRWLPASGMTSAACFILPCLAESLGGIANLARQSRSSMLEVIRSDYVTTARAKGLSEMKVIFGHALPNALLPIISVLGGRLGMTLGGSLVIEQVFSIPGVGMYLISAVNNRDYPVVQGCVVFLAIVFSLVMLLTDLCYAAVDPLIRAQYTSGSAKVSKRKVSINGK